MLNFATALLIAGLAQGPAAGPSDLAAAFGAREAVRDASLSPDGKEIAFTAPLEGQGAGLFVVPVDGSSAPRRIAVASGAPERLGECGWINAERLICELFGVERKSGFAVDFGRLLLLPAHPSGKQRAIPIGNGSLVRREGDSLLMARIGVRSGNTFAYLDRVDAMSGASRTVEMFGTNSIRIVADEAGKARIVGFRVVRGQTYQDSGETSYSFRPAGSSDLKPFGRYDGGSRDGFLPVMVDSASNRAFGFRKQDGRIALFSKTLDEAGTETLVFAHPEVDVGGLIRIGSGRHLIGVSYTTDRRHIHYLDPAMAALAASLARAIPNLPIVDIVDSSADEQKLLIRASSDVDPGRYYLLDRATRQLRVLLQARPELDGARLAPVRTIAFRSRDGKSIPGYLTLPASGGRGLPAIVLPHGGPSARDDWGFDWLAQYYAAKGYAVLQPNFRGSAGYGDAFLPLEGFRSWRTAISDVADGARWLVSEGIADPKRLAILGWSYGGYAALQTAATEPDLFKAVVAIAPVTDLAALIDASSGYSDHAMTQAFLGSGAALAGASPVDVAAQISAPVMLVHGKLDLNVPYGQSTRMAAKLKAAGRAPILVSFDGLDHQLDDSRARRELLEQSESFIRRAIGGGTTAKVD